MDSKTISKRILSSESSISGFSIQNGILAKSELKTLIEVSAILNNSKFYIDDSSRISLFTLRSEARKLKKLYGLDAVFVDYISLITTELKNTPLYEAVAFVSKSLKKIARELEIPLIALSQLTRNTEGREPTLASLRESGALEQDADLVILLHKERDSSQNKDEVNIKLTVAKHRNGRVGTLNMKFLHRFTKFIDNYTEI